MPNEKKKTWRIQAEGLDLTGADPNSWELIANIQSLGFPTTLPEPRYHCTNCGETCMRYYEECPWCDSQGSISRRETPDTAAPKNNG